MNLKKYQFIFLIVILAISLMLNIAFIIVFNTSNTSNITSITPEVSSFVPQISPPNAPPPNY
jgi:predicted neutral ceramidase superfamily lipid hydrolase